MPRIRTARTLVIAVLLSACTDIIEEDLDGMGVVLLAPASGYSSAVNQISFRWEEVPHAARYHLQVARPGLANPDSYPLDSLLTATSFTFSFSPGSYEWRLRAENENSHTDWYSRAFTVISTGSLTGLVPVLVSPSNNYLTDSTSVTFVWDTLPHTVDHRFELRSESQTGTLLHAVITPARQLTLDALADGRYAWGVQAQNDVPSSSEFSYRLFTVDATPPSAPTLLLPANGATTADAHVNFVWQSGIDALTGTTDSLIVRNDQLTVVVASALDHAPFADSLAAGDYTWIVKTLDGVGNSATSSTFTFTVP